MTQRCTNEFRENFSSDLNVGVDTNGGSAG